MNPEIYLDGNWIEEAFELIWRKGETPVIEQGGAMCLPPHLTRNPIFIREEYISLWNYVEKVRIPPLFGSGGIAVIGQPGTGEYRLHCVIQFFDESRQVNVFEVCPFHGFSKKDPGCIL